MDKQSVGGVDLCFSASPRSSALCLVVGWLFALKDQIEQEFFKILWIPHFYHHVYKIPQLNLILSQTNPICVFKLHELH